MSRRLRSAIVIVLLLTGLSLACFGSAEETGMQPVFVFSPMAGWVKNKVMFTNPGTNEKQTFIDESPIYGFDLVYITPRVVLGATGHRNDSATVSERGLLWHGNYFFSRFHSLQPTVGLAIENISLYSQLSSADVPGLVSLDAFNDIMSTHATAGVVFDNIIPNELVKVKLTPFAGYFNEKVRAIISSPGVRIGASNRYGFEAESNADLDYLSLGAKIELDLHHFLRLDSKVYYRLKSGAKTYYTLRNRIDIFFNQKLGVSAKIDYFKDKYETNLFIMAGPALVF